MLTLECMFGNHVCNRSSALDCKSDAHEESCLLSAGIIDLCIPLYYLLRAHKSVIALTVDVYAIACDFLALLIWYLYCLLEVIALSTLCGDGWTFALWQSLHMLLSAVLFLCQTICRLWGICVS